MKLTITEEEVTIYDCTYMGTADSINFTCRTASMESLAWAMQRLADEMAKTAAFYRTGIADESVNMEDSE